MNLINELNEKRYTLPGLSDYYFAQVMGIVTRISRNGKLDKDTFNSYAYKDSRLDYVPYEEFFEMTQLLKRYEDAVHDSANGGFSKMTGQAGLWKKQIQKLTNRALTRHLAQDMCAPDTKAILGQNYLALEKLGYDGRQDQAIPEIVRGNFNIFQRNKEKRESIKILDEAIDRSILYLLTVGPRATEEMQVYAIGQILEDGKSIQRVRSDLKSKGRAPFDSYKEQFLEDYHEEQFKGISENLDVYNEQQMIKDKAMDGMMEVNENMYKRLSNLGYDGKDGHPLLQTGYKMYVDSYVLDKELNYCLDVSASLCYELCCRHEIVGGWAAMNSSTRKDVDPMTNLIIELSWKKAKSKYRKGKMDKEKYDKMASLVHEMDVAMENEKIFTAIGDVKKVKAVREKNEPHWRRM